MIVEKRNPPSTTEEGRGKGGRTVRKYNKEGTD